MIEPFKHQERLLEGDSFAIKVHTTDPTEPPVRFKVTVDEIKRGKRGIGKGVLVTVELYQTFNDPMDAPAGPDQAWAEWQHDAPSKE